MSRDDAAGAPARARDPHAGRLAALRRATEDWERQRAVHGHRPYVDWAARSTEPWERQRPHRLSERDERPRSRRTTEAAR